VAEHDFASVVSTSVDGVRHRVLLRVVSLAGLALVCLVFPAVGPNRFLLAALLLVLTPVPALLPRLVNQRGWMVAQSSFDVIGVVSLIGLVPDAWTAGLVIVISSPTAGAALLGRSQFVLLESGGVIGLGVVALVTGVENWQVPLAVAALMIPVVASYVDVFFTRELSAAARLNEVAQSSAALFWEVDAATGTFITVSGRVENVLGFRPEELPDELPQLILSPDRPKWWQAVEDRSRDRFVLECRSRHRDGHVVWLRMTVQRLTARGRRVLRGVSVDITELVTAHEEVRRRAETDELTALPNRASFVERLELLAAEGRRFAVFLLDLDRFKNVNDTLGHQAGDDYLREIAIRLANRAGELGMVARMGGDEFAVVIEFDLGIDAVMDLASELLGACEKPFDLAGLEFAGSASIGIAVSPLHGRAAADLLRRADLAMYAAKRAGTGIHLFEFTSDEVKVSQLKLSTEASSGLASGQMKLWFQPQIELATGELAGAEGLLRWHHPEKGVLAPVDFLEFLELSRHSRALREQVIEQGARFAAQARERGLHIQTSVNVSIRDLADEDFGPLIRQWLTELAVEPADFVLEITEREIMDDRTGFERAARAVREVGAGLSIDDFGTGHSSLLRLHQLPVTELKIDRSFVAALQDDPEAGIIVGSIVELGSALGHRVVAEGIETQREVEILRELGCHLGQGYVYSPALPVDQFFSSLDDAAQRGGGGRITAT
jgi:diguanylate cyclase (GGDEF)-like protein/PAS domain S-box-containing protein